jgi:hypothetical protein
MSLINQLFNYPAFEDHWQTKICHRVRGEGIPVIRRAKAQSEFVKIKSLPFSSRRT